MVGHGNTQVNEFNLPAATVSWPVVVGRAPRLAEAYLDRPAQRAAIRTALNRAAMSTQERVVVVAGNGGTGKTQLAADAFGHALASETALDSGYGVPRVDLAVWVTASSPEAILSTYAQAYVALAPEMGGATTGGAAGAGAQSDAAQQAEAFLAWLTTTDRAWLVVLDDVADPAVLAGAKGRAGLWPTGPSGVVILTTRRRDAALTGPGRTRIDLDVFTDEESLQYLDGKLSAVPDLPADVLEDAGGLADDLGYLPLALAQACAVIVNDAISCATYRRLLAESTLTEAFPANPSDSGDDYAYAVSSVWALVADRANVLTPAGMAMPVLNLAATLDPNGVPEDVFTTPAARTFLTAAREEVQDIGEQEAQEVSTRDARRAVRNLHRLSLLTHDPNGGPRAVRMHALTQRATLERLGPSVLVMAVRAAADALNQAWPAVENDPPRSEALRANAATLATRHPSALWDNAAHSMLFRAGHSLGDTGLVIEAVDYFTELADQAIHRLGPDHPDTLTTRSNLYYWRGRAGDPAGAATAYAELLTDLLRVFGPDHPDILTTRINLASCRGRAGDPAGAATAYAELLTDQVRVLAPDHPNTLTTRHNLAVWEEQAGDPGGAANAFTELLNDQVRVLGPDHPDTLSTRGDIAACQGQAGDPAGAATAFAELLTDQMRVLGPDHPNTLTTRSNLAHWQGNTGDPAGAATAFAELLTDRLRVLGPDHQDTLATRSNLAHWRGQAGDPAGAATAYAELLNDRLRVLGPDHPDTLNTRGNLAYWRQVAGDTTKAE